MDMFIYIHEHVKNMLSKKYSKDTVFLSISWIDFFILGIDIYTSTIDFIHKHPKLLNKFWSHKIRKLEYDKYVCINCNSHGENIIKMYCSEVIIKEIIE